MDDMYLKFLDNFEDVIDDTNYEEEIKLMIEQYTAGLTELYEYHNQNVQKFREQLMRARLTENRIHLDE